MSKPVVAVLICTLLALVASALFPPTRDIGWDGGHDVSGSWRGSTLRGPLRRAWIGDVGEEQGGVGASGGYSSRTSIQWPLVIAVQAVFLLLGGGLLTVVLRRERWRKAASAEA